MLENQQRERVIAEAATWLGTKFHHRARLKGVGVDCAQLLIGVYSNAGVIPAFTPPQYPPDFMLHRVQPVFEDIVKQFSREIKEPRPGDVVLFFVGRCYSHSAIIVKWPTELIHARFRGCVERTNYLTDSSLMQRKHKFFSAWPD